MTVHHPSCFYNRTCRPMFIANQVPVNWAVPMYGYMMPIIVTLTVATNSFIVMVLSHKYLRTATNYVLLSMAISELLTGLSCMPWFTYYYTLSGYKTDLQVGLPSFWCRAIPYMAAFLPSIFHTMAIWLTVYLAIQRYIYICVPSLVKKFCTMGQSKKMIVVICLISAIMYTPDLFASKNRSHEVVDDNKNRTHRVCYRYKTILIQKLGEDIYYNITFSTQTIFVHFIPCVLLVIFTWKLVRAIQIADQRHKMLVGKSALNNPATRSTRRKFSEFGSSSDNDNRLVRLFRQRESVSGGESKKGSGLKQNTRMLIVVILLFLITEIPAAIIFMVHVISVSLRLSLVDYQLLNILLIVRNVLIVVSYPFRFAIYCGMSQQFRDVVRQMFTGRILAFLFRGRDNSTTVALFHGGTIDQSEDKRQSVVLTTGSATLLSSIPENQSNKEEKVRLEKEIQCDLQYEPHQFDPFLSDEFNVVDLDGTSVHIKVSDSSCDSSVQCTTRHFEHINSEISVVRAALIQNTQLSAVVAQVSSSSL